MKKVLFAAIAVMAFGVSNAQEQIKKGKILVEANTGNPMIGSTGVYFAESDGVSTYNLGLDGGYFLMDGLALKAGLGFGDNGDATSFSYRLGAKYYVNNMIPVTLDFTGSSGKGVELAGETPMWMGIGAGFSRFIGNNIAIEPGIRYNHSLNENYTDKGILQFNIGFTLHL